METEKLPPIHPGEILSEEFLIPLGMSQKELAHSIGVEVRLIDDMVRGDKPINAEIALLLSRYFDTSAKFWTGLQARYDLDVAEDQLTAKIKAIRPRLNNGATPDDESPSSDECMCGCGGEPQRVTVEGAMR